VTSPSLSGDRALAVRLLQQSVGLGVDLVDLIVDGLALAGCRVHFTVRSIDCLVASWALSCWNALRVGAFWTAITAAAAVWLREGVSYPIWWNAEHKVCPGTDR
jgi:hypothetical protein